MLHPGAYVGASAKVEIASIAKGLNEVITIQIALETMTRTGTELAGASNNWRRLSNKSIEMINFPLLLIRVI